MHRCNSAHWYTRREKNTPKHTHIKGTYLGATAVITGALTVGIKLFLTDVWYTYSMLLLKTDKNRHERRGSDRNWEWKAEIGGVKNISPAYQLHRAATLAQTASARKCRARLPSRECAWAEWRWGEMTCVTSAGPLVADGLITHSPEQPVCKPRSAACVKNPDYDFLAFQIFPARRSAVDAASHSYSIPASGWLGTISLQAWPILLLLSLTHTRCSLARSETDEPRTLFLTLLSFKSGRMSVILPSPLTAW